MVEKISLNVIVLSLNLEHNFLIPSDMNVEQAVGLIVQTLLDEYPGVKHSINSPHRLIQATSGKVLNPTCSFKQLGVIQGEKLLLM